jgi:hypothetical protein
VRFGVAWPSTEPAGQPHQVSVVQRVLRSCERPPPHGESAGAVPHPKVSVQNDAVHTLVAAVQQILVELAQTTRHDRSPRRTAEHRSPLETSIAPPVGTLATGDPLTSPDWPAGATFSQRRSRKSVGSYSVIRWYGLIPIAPSIILADVALRPSAASERRQPR